MSTPTFPGLGVFLDTAVAGEPDAARARAQLAGVSLLGELSDLVGQALAAKPEHAAGILDAAEARAHVLCLAADVADDVIRFGRAAITPPDKGPDSDIPPAETTEPETQTCRAMTP